MLIPTSLPFKSTSAPPELPGFTGAWCWMKASICKLFLSLKIPIFLALALTIPAVTVDLNSNGEPTAKTHSPISTSSESPNSTIGKFFASILSTAISVVVQRLQQLPCKCYYHLAKLQPHLHYL